MYAIEITAVECCIASAVQDSDVYGSERTRDRGAAVHDAVRAPAASNLTPLGFFADGDRELHDVQATSPDPSGPRSGKHHPASSSPVS